MSLKIGDTFTSNNFGRYRVGKLDGDHAWIVFENTGNVEHPSVRTIIANGVVDYKGPYEIRVGGLYNTNNYGKVKVVRIEGTKNVTIEFVNTGNRVQTQKNIILAGLLTDKMAIAIEQKQELERKAEEQRTLKEKQRLEREAIKSADKAEADRRKKERDEQRAAEKEARRTLDSKGEMFVGTSHTDKLGMTFVVVDRAGNTIYWLVRYIETGNEYKYSEHQIRKGNAFDKKREDFFDIKSAYDKEQASLWYLANREERIKKACDYQKNNLERSRVNNQNRRSRREGADGRHTLEEIDRLMEEQEHKCACCGVALTKENKHLDHIYPLALGGTNFIWNLQWLCQFCNNSKSAAHPDDWEIYSKSEHFQAVLQSRNGALQ